MAAIAAVYGDSGNGSTGSNVGPGSYNIPGGFKKKKKKTKTVIVQQYDENFAASVNKKGGDYLTKSGAESGKMTSFSKRDDDIMTDTTSKSHFSNLNDQQQQVYGDFGLR